MSRMKMRMRTSKCMAVLLSLFMLITFGTYINWTTPRSLPKKESLKSHSDDWWTSPPISTFSSSSVFIRNITESDVSHALLLNFSLSLKGTITNENAYWNKKQHEIFHELAIHANLSSTCNSSQQVTSQIADFHTYSELYKQFVLYSGCRDFPMIINQPNKCQDNQTFLLLAIKSVSQNFEKRQAVRETWGREMVYNGLTVRMVFLLGSEKDGSSPNLQHLIRFEGEHFQDILQWDFQDSFLNLTLKDNLFLKWVTHHCPKAHFIFKGDDDVFVNTIAIMQYLESMELQRAELLYMGHIVSNASPIRDTKSKYFIPKSYYLGAYPSYAGGGGYVFSGSLAKWLYSVSRYIEFYPIDDVYTGICFQALRVEPQIHAEFQTFDIAVQERDNPCTHKKLLLVHQRTPQQLLRLWSRMQDPKLQC